VLLSALTLGRREGIHDFLIVELQLLLLVLSYSSTSSQAGAYLLSGRGAASTTSKRKW
jgi:hypothetical protein